MDFRKLMAGSTLVFLLSGCQLWDDITGTAEQISSDKSGKEVIMDAFEKMQNEVKQSHSEVVADITLGILDPEGTIKISIKDSEDQGTAQEKANLDISFMIDGDAKEQIAGEGGPEAGKATLAIVRNDLDMYFKLNELDIEPEEMNSFVEMFLPDVTSTWYYLNMNSLEGMENMNMEMLADMNLADAIAMSIVSAAEENGAPISEEAAKQIAAKLLSGEYFEVISTSNASTGTVYTTKIDYNGLKNVIKEISEIVSAETGETTPSDEELDEVIAQLEGATSDLEFDITINSQGYITGFSTDFEYKFEEGEGDGISSISVVLDAVLSNFNEDFSVEIPEDYQDLTEMMGMMGGSAYDDGYEYEYDFDSEMGFSDFYPCDYYECVEETEDRIVDSDGYVWIKGEEGWEISVE